MNIIVTGTGRGIGFEIAKQLEEKGHNVIRISKNSNKPKEFIDITSKADCDGFAKYLISKNIKIDVLINNAGIQSYSNILDKDIIYLKKDFEVNLFGTIQFTNTIIPFLNKRAKIINITSLPMTKIFNNDVFFDYIGYALSKQSLNYYTRLLANKLKDNFIVCVCPGWCNTGMGGNSPKSASEGAKEIIWLSENEIITGSIYENKKIQSWE